MEFILDGILLALWIIVAIITTIVYVGIMLCIGITVVVPMPVSWRQGLKSIYFN